MNAAGQALRLARREIIRYNSLFLFRDFLPSKSMALTALPWIGVYYLAINLLTLAAWGRDKRAAVLHRWRTPERVLRRLIWAGGFAGCLAGMVLFRHKIRRRGFTLAAAAAAAVHLLLIAGWILFQGR